MNLIRHLIDVYGIYCMIFFLFGVITFLLWAYLEFRREAGYGAQDDFQGRDWWGR